MKTLKLWENTPALDGREPVFEYYEANHKKTDACTLIFPGGGYGGHTPFEGKDYAEFLNSLGMDAFVLNYRLSPYRFPIPLLDARRALRYIRKNAESFGINPEKVGVMGSSAGGHLAAMVSTYYDAIDFEDLDEIDKENCIPNFQILCYPVISLADFSIANIGSCMNLLGTNQLSKAASLDPMLIATPDTPKAFIWHTSDDDAVHVANSLRYGEKLREVNVDFEMHIFPKGEHGLGLAKDTPHVAQWTKLLTNWLYENNLL